MPLVAEVIAWRKRSRYESMVPRIALSSRITPAFPVAKFHTHDRKVAMKKLLMAMLALTDDDWVLVATVDTGASRETSAQACGIRHRTSRLPEAYTSPRGVGRVMPNPTASNP